MNTKEAFALGYFYGRSEGSYGLLDLDQFSEEAKYEFKLGYERGVFDYSVCDTEGEINA
jgi:hypothetical protein